jgi:hypothetical protein
MDAFGNTYTYTDPNSQASNNKLPEGNVTIGHCKVLEWDCTLPEQDPNSSTLTPIGTQTTVEGRPTFDVLAAGYPTPADYDAKQLGDLIGGKVKQNLDSGVFTNTCSLRLSRAFNEAGLLLPFAPGQGNSSSGGDGNWYYPRLSTFENYVQDYWGAPMVIAPSDYPKAISGQPGLLIFQVQFSDASGHGTLWNGQNTIDGSNYSSRSTQILFWPVRPPPPPPPPTPGHR